MNFKIFLSLIAIATGTVMAQPEAQAQGARFKFAPTVYKLEEPTGAHVPSVYNPPPRTVNSGSVPKGHSMLGFNPAMLKKQAPPVAVIQAQPSTQASLMPAAFNNLFGKPTSAQTNALPLTAAPATAMPMAATPQKVAKQVSRSNGVSGRLRTRPAQRPMIARSASPNSIASYGGRGYQPGSTVPTGSFGSGGGTTQDVNGKIIRK
jgi:hypothetical protein